MCAGCWPRGRGVVASDLPGARAEALQAAHAGNPQFRFYELDVATRRRSRRFSPGSMGDGWQPNVVLNNAAIHGRAADGRGRAPSRIFANTSVSDWERTLRTNLTGAFMIARQMDRDIVGKWPCAPDQCGLDVYALNGPHHQIYEGMPFKSFSAYSTTKAGIHGLTLWLAGYWRSGRRR